MPAGPLSATARRQVSSRQLQFKGSQLREAGRIRSKCEAVGPFELATDNDWSIIRLLYPSCVSLLYEFRRSLLLTLLIIAATAALSRLVRAHRRPPFRWPRSRGTIAIATTARSTWCRTAIVCSRSSATANTCCAGRETTSSPTAAATRFRSCATLPAASRRSSNVATRSRGSRRPCPRRCARC